MKIKICGLSRNEDIAYINEARPDYAGFVFAASKRQVTPAEAALLRRNLARDIIPVGVFVDAPIETIAALYNDGIIAIAQLHGGENEEYILRLKEACFKNGRSGPVPVIKTIRSEELEKEVSPSGEADYYLIDSGAGSGKSFNWDLLKNMNTSKPWFLAGGINVENISRAAALNPYGIDISSGAETDGKKDREKILRLTTIVREGSIL
jgi:phosphoribosylanthranilate isomerase